MQRGTKLPLHWSYVDAWTLGRSRWIDNRQPGFQVWISLASAVAALAGMDKDGSYTADEYPVFLLIRTREVHDSPGEWYSIYPEDVTSVRAMRSNSVLANVYGAMGYQADPYEMERWVENNESWLVRRLLVVSNRVPIRWMETLPRPRRPQAM